MPGRLFGGLALGAFTVWFGAMLWVGHSGLLRSGSGLGPLFTVLHFAALPRCVRRLRKRHSGD